MSIALDTNQRSLVEEAAGNYDGGITEYSGRCMYGTTCLGINLDDLRKVTELLVYIAGDDHNLATTLANNLTLDDMGRGVIAYWPIIAFDGFTDFDNEDDDDN